MSLPEKDLVIEVYSSDNDDIISMEMDGCEEPKQHSAESAIDEEEPMPSQEQGPSQRTLKNRAKRQKKRSERRQPVVAADEMNELEKDTLRKQKSEKAKILNQIYRNRKNLDKLKGTVASQLALESAQETIRILEQEKQQLQEALKESNAKCDSFASTVKDLQQSHTELMRQAEKKTDTLTTELQSLRSDFNRNMEKVDILQKELDTYKILTDNTKIVTDQEIALFSDFIRMANLAIMQPCSVKGRITGVKKLYTGIQSYYDKSREMGVKFMHAPNMP